MTITPLYADSASNSAAGPVSLSLTPYPDLQEGDLLLLMFGGRSEDIDGSYLAGLGQEFVITEFLEEQVPYTSESSFCRRLLSGNNGSSTNFSRLKAMTVGDLGSHPAEYEIKVDDPISPNALNILCIGQFVFRGDHPLGYWVDIADRCTGNPSTSSQAYSPAMPYTTGEDLSIRGFLRAQNTPSGGTPAWMDDFIAEFEAGLNLRGAYGFDPTYPQLPTYWNPGTAQMAHMWSLRWYEADEFPPEEDSDFGRIERPRIHYPDWAFTNNPAQLDENYKVLERFCRTGAATKCNLKLRHKPTPAEQTENWYKIERWARVYVTGTDCLCDTGVIPNNPICFLRVPNKDWATTTKNPALERENWMAVERWFTMLRDPRCNCVFENPDPE